MKKKQQQLQADQDLLNDKWTEVLAAEEYGLKRLNKSYPKRRLLPEFDDEALEPKLPARDTADRPPSGQDKPTHVAEQEKTHKLEDIQMTCGTTWKGEHVNLDRSTDRRSAP